jgi:excisionase family DNA binding protein
VNTNTVAERLTISVEEAAAMLGVSRTSAYEYVRTGQLPAIRMGRRILVPVAAIERLLDPIRIVMPQS